MKTATSPSWRHWRTSAIAGAGVGRGYLNDPRNSPREKFIPDPFDCQSGLTPLQNRRPCSRASSTAISSSSAVQTIKSRFAATVSNPMKFSAALCKHDAIQSRYRHSTQRFFGRVFSRCLPHPQAGHASECWQSAQALAIASPRLHGSQRLCGVGRFSSHHQWQSRSRRSARARFQQIPLRTHLYLRRPRLPKKN